MEEAKKLSSDTLIDPKLVSLTKFFSEAISILVVLVGALNLIGWKFNLAVLKSVSAGFVTMKPNTAIGLIFLGASLWFLQEKRLKHWARYFGYGSAIVAILIGAMVIFQYFLGFNLGIDNLFFTETAPALFTTFPGRMALNTAFILVFLGVSLLSFNIKTKRDLCLCSLTAILSGAAALFVILGYLHDLSDFYFAGVFYTLMALHTAISFFLISLGILLARPESRLIKIFTRNDSIGITVRRILPLVFIVSLVVGKLEWFGLYFNLYNRDFGHALVSIVSITILVSLVWWNAVKMTQKEEQRAQTQELLIKSTEEVRRLGFLIEHTAEAVALVDFEGGNVLRYVNHAWEKLFGFSKQEAVNKKEPLIIEAAKRDPTLNKKLKDCIASHTPFQAEMEWRRKDGALIPVEVFSSSSRDVLTGKYIWLNTIHDISARKKAEKEKIIIDQSLRRSEESLKNAQRISHLGNWEWDISTNDVFWSDEVYRIYGYKPGEIQPNFDVVLRAMSPESIEAFKQGLDDAIKGKKPFEMDYELFRKDGSKAVLHTIGAVIYDQNKAPLHMTGTVLDITAHKKAEEEIKKEQLKSAALAGELEKFKLAVDGANEHIIITDAEGGVIYANKAVETITGFSPAEVLGKKPGKIWGGHMSIEFYKKMWHRIKIEKKGFIGEVNNYKKNSTPYVASLNITPILDKNGAVEFFVGIERDITKEKKVEEMKNDFISFVSHQLRTPLTVMRWNAEMLLSADAGKLNREQKRYIAEIDRGEQRMALLINSLLNISRLESGRLKINPKPVDLEEFIGNIVAEDTPYATAKNCTIIFTKPKKKLPPVKIDEMLTKEVISNLLNNAIRYSQTKKCDINVSLEISGEFYQINIVDHGIGIPIDVQNKIFTKFYRADNAVKVETEGTGLGLYMTKLIVETGGGKIWFESTEGKGSAFHFTISKAGMREVKGEKELSI